MSIPNLYPLESVRGWYDGWHERLLNRGIPVEDSRLTALDASSLGVELDADVLDHPNVTIIATDFDACRRVLPATRGEQEDATTLRSG